MKDRTALDMRRSFLEHRVPEASRHDEIFKGDRPLDQVFKFFLVKPGMKHRFRQLVSHLARNLEVQMTSGSYHLRQGFGEVPVPLVLVRVASLPMRGR